MTVLLYGSAYVQGEWPRIRNDYKGRGIGCQDGGQMLLSKIEK
jgi:hypothetical protein